MVLICIKISPKNISCNIMEEVNKVERQDIIGEVSHLEFLSYGTIQIFDRRANKLRTLRSWLTFLGIVLPVTIGGVYLSFGQSENLMKLTVLVASIIGIFQLILSTWALVAGWDTSYESAIKSVQGNTAIYNKCKRFISYPPIKDSDFLNVYQELSKEAETQELVDLTQHISSSERKYAYVSALRYYNRECHACQQNPNGHNKKMKCTSCGQKPIKETSNEPKC
ncbi:hypothetical protein CGG80_23865 [Vibrio parahaemolyticus]|nr:hypothetical protein CGH03_23370 [Vibrio parahaemolyticus]TOR11612.1 hypothetical protein CGG80_23865 [Vibrio parahaemolyticus]